MKVLSFVTKKTMFAMLLLLAFFCLMPVIVHAETKSQTAVTKLSVSDSNKEKASFSKKKITKTFGAVPFTNKMKTNATGMIFYYSSNENVATVNKDGKVCIMGTGKCKITVKIKEDWFHNGCTGSYTLVVKPRSKTKVRQIRDDEWNLYGYYKKKLAKQMKKDYKKVYQWVKKAGVTDGMNPEVAMQKMANYICSQCSYDNSSKLYEMKDMLYYHTGVCNAYAELLMAMGKTAGIDCRLQTGYYLNLGYHGWNKFKTTKGWRYIDACLMDSGLNTTVSKKRWSSHHDIKDTRNYWPEYGFWD